MTDWTSFVTSDIMGNLAFSRSWNMMDSRDNRHIIKVISDGVAALNLVSHKQS